MLPKDSKDTYLVTRSNVKFDLVNVSAVNVRLEDIAWSLARIPRFIGHSRAFRSVAAHSVSCAALARRFRESERVQLLCVLHDAHEAYLGDLISPVVNVMPLEVAQWWVGLKNRVQQAIWERFHVSPPDESEHMLISTYDLMDRHNERAVWNEEPVVEYNESTDRQLFISTVNTLLQQVKG